MLKNTNHSIARLFFVSIVSPRQAFARLDSRYLVMFALLLMGLRWSVAPFSTVLNLYHHPVPMLLPPPLAMEPQLYRYYEIFWYGPYGFFMMLAIAVVLFALARRMVAEGSPITFDGMLGITAIAFFTPWLFTLPLDVVVIASGHGAPQFLVPLHLSILAWEAWLVMLGARVRFGLSPSQAMRLGGAAAGVFIILGGVLIR